MIVLNNSADVIEHSEFPVLVLPQGWTIHILPTQEPVKEIGKFEGIIKGESSLSITSGSLGIDAWDMDEKTTKLKEEFEALFGNRFKEIGDFHTSMQDIFMWREGVPSITDLRDRIIEWAQGLC